MCFFSRGSTSFDPVAWRCLGEWMSSHDSGYDIYSAIIVSLLMFEAQHSSLVKKCASNLAYHWEFIVAVVV